MHNSRCIYQHSLKTYANMYQTNYIPTQPKNIPDAACGSPFLKDRHPVTWVFRTLLRASEALFSAA